MNRVLQQGLRHALAGFNFRSWANVEVVFVLSTGRTGTMRLARLFERVFAGVDARHEPAPDLFRIGTAYQRGQLSHAAAVRALRVARYDVLRDVQSHKPIKYGEFNNNASFLIPVIRDVMPHARFAHVVRDGRDVVRSMYSKRVGAVDGSGKTALFMTAEESRTRLQAVDYPDDPFAPVWGELTRFEKLAWYWTKKNDIIAEALRHDEHAITLKFEDLFAAPEYTGLRRLAEFIGVGDQWSARRDQLHSALVEKSNRTEQYLLPHHAHWDAELTRAFDRIAGAAMRSYGYTAPAHAADE